MMKGSYSRRLRVAAILGLVLAGPSLASDGEVRIFANGLYNPKDFEFNDDGSLLVAEAGAPGQVRVPLPAQYGSEGPIGYGGRVSRVSSDGRLEEWITGLPNLGIYSGAELLGPSGLARLGGKLYLVQAAHLTESPFLNEVLPEGKLRRIVDIGAFNKKNLASEDNGDAVPTGNPYDLIAWNGALYISDGNYNRILRATPDGELSIFAQSPTQTTTTGMAIGPDGALYVAQFGNAPYYPGSGRVDRVTADGKWERGVVKGLQNPVDVAFDSKGRLYVLQFASLFSPAKLKYLPYGGKVLRVEGRNRLRPVLTNLTYPTFIKFDSSDRLWVANYGNQSSRGEGQLLRVRLGSGSLKGPQIVPPADAPTEEALRAEAKALVNLSRMNEAQAKLDGFVIRVSEGTDTLRWGYEPAIAKVKKGQVVTFINSGKVPHTATSTKGAFDTGYMQAGEIRKLQMNDVGAFDYLCTPHPWMKGKIIVEGAAGTAATAASGAMAGVALGGRLVSPFALGALFVALIGATVLVAYGMRRKD